MAWYSTGTVNVTNGSAALVGVGTAWLDAVQPGWAFFGPDGRPYQVLTVNSNTSITLAKVYTGSTLTGQAYDLIPTQGFVRTLAQRVSDLIATYAGFVTTRLAGLFGAGSVSAPGVAREGDTNTGIYWPADDALAVATGGVERARFSENSGVGTSAPLSRWHINSNTPGVADLTGSLRISNESFTPGTYAGVLFGTADTLNSFVTAVRQSGFGGALVLAVNNGTNASSLIEVMRLTQDGRVGIGTATPAARLHLDTGAAGTGLIVAASFDTSSQVVAGIGQITAGRPFLGTSIGSNALDFGTRAAVPLIFLTDSVERMRIDAAGNVGIGTASPTATIDSAGDTIRTRGQRTIATPTTAGNTGDHCWDDTYEYRCIAPNTWRRWTRATW